MELCIKQVNKSLQILMYLESSQQSYFNQYVRSFYMCHEVGVSTQVHVFPPCTAEK